VLARGNAHEIAAGRDDAEWTIKVTRTVARAMMTPFVGNRETRNNTAEAAPVCFA